MKAGKVLQVRWDEDLVGTLALTADHKAAFEYNDDWMGKILVSWNMSMHCARKHVEFK